MKNGVLQKNEKYVWVHFFGGFTCCCVYSKTTYKHILFIQGIEGHLIVIMSIFISFLVD